MRTVLPLIVAGMVIGLPATHVGGSRMVLTDVEMGRLVGGEAAAVTFKKPEGVITLVNNQTTGSLRPATVFNLKGNRCQYGIGTGTSNVGFDVASSNAPNALNAIFVIGGTAAPNLEVWEGSGGTGNRRVAFTTATFAGSTGVSDPLEWDLYTAAIRTQCVGGTNNGQLCHTPESCPGGFCRTCDQAGNCNGSTNPSGPCVGQCLSGANAGAPCLTAGDCPSSLCLANPRQQTPNGACYLLTGCCSGSGCTNCVTNGVDQSGPGPFHAAVARVTHGAGVIGYSERVIRMENGNSNNPREVCSTDCDGPVDASGMGIPPPACEN